MKLSVYFTYSIYFVDNIVYLFMLNFYFAKRKNNSCLKEGDRENFDLQLALCDKYSKPGAPI